MMWRVTRKSCVTAGVWALAAILFPLHTFASDYLPKKPVPVGRVYLIGIYKSSFPDFDGLEVSERQLFVPGVGTAVKMSMKGDVIVDVNDYGAFGVYKPPFYSGDYLNFVGGVGYSVGHVRLELERFGSEFAVKGGTGSVNQDDASNIALVRGGVITSGNYVVVENKKVGISSLAFNVCYERGHTDVVLTYACVGVSGNRLNLLNTSSVTHGYQGKIGLGVSVTKNTALLAGAYYHMLHRNSFDPIVLTVPRRFYDMPKPAAAEANMRVAHLGGELGIRYMFR
ncbi:P44/Msp2 family outer membrane protein [Anaplasma capra]|uniref:P44/Msp2 family outer membrane protein n=1 Tax=Anaplasma capra TaxID=1562740 RepID=UPI0021D5BF7E|nr:P44/Msp2 family outer membrane protein [Anaplasma capra]